MTGIQQVLNKGASLSFPLQVRSIDLRSCDITINALSIDMHEKPHCAQIQKAKHLKATRGPLDASPCSLSPIPSLSRNPHCRSCFPAAQTTLHCTSSPLHRSTQYQQVLWEQVWGKREEHSRGSSKEGPGAGEVGG